MNKNISGWLRIIAFDSVFVGCFYFWKAHGIQGAGNVFLALAWFVCVVSILIGFIMDKSHFKEPRPIGAKTYNVYFDVAMACTMAWFEMFWLAGFYVVACCCMAVARERAPKVPAE